MKETSWSQFVNQHKGRDNDTQIAKKLGTAPSTVGRWGKGSTPDPDTAVKFAQKYHANPLSALLAAGHISQTDIADEVTFSDTAGLDEYSTDALLKEVAKRVELMGEYSEWLRAIAASKPSMAGLGVDALRYIDPFTPPTKSRGEDFIEALQPDMRKVGEYEGAEVWAVRPDDVGTSPEDDLHTQDLSKEEHDLAASTDASVVKTDR